MNSPIKRFFSDNHGEPLRMDSRATTSRYRSRTEKNRMKEELTVMVLSDDGSSELYTMTRPEILQLSKEDAKRLRTLPFGEMKMKDLRMLDPNVSFGSEPKLIVCYRRSTDSPGITNSTIDGVLQSVKSSLKSILQANMDEDRVGSTGSPSPKDEQEPLDVILEDLARENQDEIKSEQGRSSEAAKPSVLTAEKNEIKGTPDKSLEVKPNNVGSAIPEVAKPNEAVSATPEVSKPNDVVSATPEVPKPSNVVAASPEAAQSETPEQRNGVTQPPVEPTESRDFGSDTDSIPNKEVRRPDAGSPHMLRSFRRLSRLSSVESVQLENRLQKRTLLRTRSYDSRDETPFQFVALELLFDTAALSFKKDVDYLKLARDQVKTIVAANELVTKVSALRSKLVATRQTIEDFVSDDKDLGLFSFNSIVRYYSEPEFSPSQSNVDAWRPYEMDVNEVEDLAEDFVSRLDDAINELDMLKFTVEELISNFRHQVDERRERLMKLHVRIQGVTGIAAGPTLVAGIFGMNLTSGLMVEDTFNFWITFSFLLGFFVIGTVLFVGFSDRLLVGQSGSHR